MKLELGQNVLSKYIHHTEALWSSKSKPFSKKFAKSHPDVAYGPTDTITEDQIEGIL